MAMPMNVVSASNQVASSAVMTAQPLSIQSVSDTNPKSSVLEASGSAISAKYHSMVLLLPKGCLPMKKQSALSSCNHPVPGNLRLTSLWEYSRATIVCRYSLKRNRLILSRSLFLRRTCFQKKTGSWMIPCWTWATSMRWSPVTVSRVSQNSLRS